MKYNFVQFIRPRRNGLNAINVQDNHLSICSEAIKLFSDFTFLQIELDKKNCLIRLIPSNTSGSKIKQVPTGLNKKWLQTYISLAGISKEIARGRYNFLEKDSTGFIFKKS
jgi:hypothetical protein